MKNKIIYVEWNDSSSSNGWQNREDVANRVLKDKKYMLCRSVGFFVAENKEKLIICLSVDAWNVAGGDFMTIPKPCILKRKYIKL